MTRSKKEIWIGVIVGGIALLMAAIPALELFMKAITPNLHPTPQDAPSVTQPAPPEKWAAAVEQGRQYVRASLNQQNLPGLSAAVGVSGELVWAEGFGFADLDTRVPVTPDHRFRIGTASTVLTSAAAGLLFEQGRLKLDEPIQTYVPQFPKKKTTVTLRQVMGHVAGISSDGGDEGPLFREQCARPVDALPHFANRLLEFEPGSSYKFSRYGWIAVSAAIETASDQPFLTFMRKQVFEPLGMTNTFAAAAAGPELNSATFYFPRFAADPIYGLHPMREINLSCYAGSSVFLSTPADLVRFGMAINGGKLLKPATVQLMQTSQRLVSGAETGYGLGWDLETVKLAEKHVREAGHNGDVLGGMVASLLTFPEQEIVVAVTSNISYADTFSVGAMIAQAFAAQSK